MKTKTSCVLFALMMLAGLTFGQDYAFKVLVNKGKNEVKSGNNWQPIKVGGSLKSVDELKVSENSYLGLVHVSGKPLELKESGQYKVVDLAAKVGGGSSVLNKYTDFILSANEKKLNNLAATGAVHRGVNNIKLFLPGSELALIYNDNIIIQWEKDKAPAPYTVTFNSLFGEELRKVETSENSVFINLDDAKFKNEDNIIVKVLSKSGNRDSDEYTLKKLSKADRERIKTSLGEIASQTEEQTALNKLVLAGFYEQNKLLIDAATAYQQAVQLEPTVEPYMAAYDDFLIRNGLKTIPKEK